jgi:hypothetical protein
MVKLPRVLLVRALTSFLLVLTLDSKATPPVLQQAWMMRENRFVVKMDGKRGEQVSTITSELQVVWQRMRTPRHLM